VSRKSPQEKPTLLGAILLACHRPGIDYASVGFQDSLDADRVGRWRESPTSPPKARSGLVAWAIPANATGKGRRVLIRLFGRRSQFGEMVKLQLGPAPTPHH
jgi:hypothetical protein